MFRARIAPTPNGYLHTGNAVNFVITWLWTRKENGVLRLRLDDRSTPDVKDEHLNEIFDTLHWLGIDWDEGPQTPGEQRKIYSQHLHNEEYEVMLGRLAHIGKVYACTCTRKTIQGQGADQQNNCTCREKKIPLHQPDVTWRIVTPANLPVVLHDVTGDKQVDLFTEMHDFAVRRRDGVATYQVVSLTDDIAHHTNLIVRGMDLLPSTAAQLFLAEVIGDQVFKQATFYHHSLLKDEAGEKLSKSAKSEALRPQWREPEKFFRWMSQLLGWKQEATTLQQMLQQVKAGATVLLPEGN